MEYVVELSRRAERDLGELFEYLDASNSTAARRWLDGLEKAIGSLEHFPRRCRRAPEARLLGGSIRQLLYGRKANVYRILFVIDEAEHRVQVLTIRHGARDKWRAVKSGSR